MTVPSPLRVLEVASGALAAVIDEPLPRPGIATRVVTAAAPEAATGRDVRVLGVAAGRWLVVVEAADAAAVTAAVGLAGAAVRDVSAEWTVSDAAAGSPSYELTAAGNESPRWLVPVAGSTGTTQPDGRPAADRQAPARQPGAGPAQPAGSPSPR